VAGRSRGSGLSHSLFVDFCSLVCLLVSWWIRLSAQAVGSSCPATSVAFVRSACCFILLESDGDLDVRIHHSFSCEFPANMSDHRPVLPEDPRARRGTSRINPRRHRPKIRPRELCCRCFVIAIDRRQRTSFPMHPSNSTAQFFPLPN
jgi:hypothetical protein